MLQHLKKCALSDNSVKRELLVVKVYIDLTYIMLMRDVCIYYSQWVSELPFSLEQTPPNIAISIKTAESLYAVTKGLLRPHPSASLK